MSHKTKTDLYSSDGGNPDLYRFRDWYTQKKPWIHPLAFGSRTDEYLKFEGYYYDFDGSYHLHGRPSIITSLLPMEDGLAEESLAINKAYSKFVDQMKDSAQNANNLLEAKGNIGQIIQHVSSLSKAAHAVKKGDIVAAGRALGVSISNQRGNRIKARAKQASDRWLELHFGWVPLVQDIGTSIDVIQGTGQASPKAGISRVSTQGHGSFYGRAHSSSYEVGNASHRYLDWKASVLMKAVVSVSNPNLAVANQMGFVNPLSVAWEAVPFSFVVDWFSNVGQCLSAMTDFWGFTVEDGFTTSFMQMTRDNLDSSDFSTVPIGYRGYIHEITKGVRVVRTPGITGPSLKTNPFHGFSPTRGATAISLLVQQLAGLKK